MTIVEALEDMRLHGCSGGQIPYDDPKAMKIGWVCPNCWKRWLFSIQKFRDEVPQYFERIKTREQRLIFPLAIRGIIFVLDEREEP